MARCSAIRKCQFGALLNAWHLIWQLMLNHVGWETFDLFRDAFVRWYLIKRSSDYDVVTQPSARAPRMRRKPSLVTLLSLITRYLFYFQELAAPNQLTKSASIWSRLIPICVSRISRSECTTAAAGVKRPSRRAK